MIAAIPLAAVAAASYSCRVRATDNLFCLRYCDAAGKEQFRGLVGKGAFCRPWS